MKNTEDLMIWIDIVNSKDARNHICIGSMGNPDNYAD